MVYGRVQFLETLHTLIWQILCCVAGPLLLPGLMPDLDIVYGYTSWGVLTPESPVDCGAPGDLSFFVNVAALSDFLAPYLAPPTAPAAAALAPEPEGLGR